MPASKMSEWFGGRRWRIVDVTGTGFVAPDGRPDSPMVPVYFDHGRFDVERPVAFKSPLSGNPGRHGWLLQEIGPDGADIEGSRHPFGDAAVRQAREEFHAII